MLDDDLSQELKLRIVFATGSRRRIANPDSYVIKITETTSIDGLVKAKLQIQIVVKKSSLSFLTVS
jgi:DNA-directed RNA polymerase specialized sigma24 family protein